MKERGMKEKRNQGKVEKKKEWNLISSIIDYLNFI